MSQYPTVITVSVLNRYIKSVLEGDDNLRSLFIRGQISNFKNNSQSGHFYFTLKDEKSQVRAVMFRFANQRLKFTPENDMNVIVSGKVSLYEVSGEYQLYVDDMQPDGMGALAIAFEQLKKKLAAEGLFDASHKKPIPSFPHKIGVVTSENGAAVKDIINIISRRYPSAEIVLCPVMVQGSVAAEQIAAAIRLFNEKHAADVLIVGRGGGSIEDLWAFNEETTARAVYESKIPVISAVGHETDYTICDFAADLRAETPSAAAELAVPDTSQVISELHSYTKLFKELTDKKLIGYYSKLNSLTGSLTHLNPEISIGNLIIRIDKCADLLNSAFKHELSLKQNELSIIAAKLDLLSPLKILSKGYSLVTKDGVTVTDVNELSKGDKIIVRFNNGCADCEVL